MKNRYRIFLNQARGGYFYVQDRITRRQESLGTKDKATAQRLVSALNEADRQPAINRQIAQAYLRAADPKMVSRTWQNVMDAILDRHDGETLRRWKTAVKDAALDVIRKRPLVETTAEELLNVIKLGTVCTNVYMRRLHNYALDMDWILKPIVPKRQWPKVVHRKGKAIQLKEHQRIIEREHNEERRAYYDLLWHLGGSQSDVAFLNAEDVDWKNRTITYSRKKLLHRGADPAAIRFGDEVALILRRLPQHGPLFPYLRSVRAGDRSTEFKQRCDGLGIKGVSLHSYRYAWAQRAAEAGFPERWAQQALGHGSKAFHRAYARKAEATVPTPEAWLKDIEEKTQFLAPQQSYSSSRDLSLSDFSCPERLMFVQQGRVLICYRPAADIATPLTALTLNAASQGTVELLVTSSQGGPLQLQGSTNLTHWQPLTNLQTVPGLSTFELPLGNQQKFFYRGVTQ